MDALDERLPPSLGEYEDRSFWVLGVTDGRMGARRERKYLDHVRLESGGTVPPSHHGHDLERWPLRDTLKLRALPDAVPSARAHLRQLLSGGGWAELSPDAGVVVSELVTNAVAASAGLRPAAPVLVWLGSDSHCLLLAVADVSPRPPVRLNRGPDAEGGRGLALVEALSDRWGWHPAAITGLKKVVWAEWHLAEEETMPGPPVPDPAAATPRPQARGYGRISVTDAACPACRA